MNYVIELDENTYEYFKGIVCSDDRLPMSSNAFADEGYQLRLAMIRAEAEVAWEEYLGISDAMNLPHAYREYASKEEFFANEFFITV